MGRAGRASILLLCILSIACASVALSQPDCANAFYSRAFVIMGLGRCDDALAGFDRAIELHPEWAEGHTGRGLALSKLSRYEEALTAYDTAVRLRPNAAWPVYHSACADARLGRRDAALADLRNAIARDAKDCAQARTDEDFTALRDDPEFRDLVGLDRNEEGVGPAPLE